MLIQHVAINKVFVKQSRKSINSICNFCCDEIDTNVVICDWCGLPYCEYHVRNIEEEQVCVICTRGVRPF